MFFGGSTLVITGGTGTLGHGIVRRLLASQDCPARIVILSRDELKQAKMRAGFGDDPRLRFFIGDVRDLARLRLAFRGAHNVIHCAALKRVEVCEYDPWEAAQTNVCGTHNVITAALEAGVKRCVAISTDKACQPVNVYGKTKALLEGLITGATAYAGKDGTRFCAVRYGNVAGSNGSVIPLWRKAIAEGKPLQILDPEATRFWFLLNEAVDLVLWALRWTQGGELVVPTLPSFHVPDLAAALAPGHPVVVTQPRTGDKRHEAMIGQDEAVYFRRLGPHFVRFHEPVDSGQPLPPGFEYVSNRNERWLGVPELREALSHV